MLDRLSMPIRYEEAFTPSYSCQAGEWVVMAGRGLG